MSGDALLIPRLGVNVDHVATVRNARGGTHPDPLRAASDAVAAGADGITMHLREDRRHIRDEDVTAYARNRPAPLNLEMAATDEMRRFALEIRPNACCLVPEKREERTTEGGLDVAGQRETLAALILDLQAAEIRVSLFVDPEPAQLEAAAALGAPVVELHTGDYCDAVGAARRDELERLRRAATAAAGLGLEVHAGHGLSFETVEPVAALAEIAELNIGHFLIGEAVFTGLGPTVTRMKSLMTRARSGGRSV